MHKFYVDHPSIKRSPIANDVLWLRTGPGKEDRVKVAKLLSEVSLTDVYLDFIRAHPDVKIGERSFRKLRPQELRRMTTRHLDMCGCRCTRLTSISHRGLPRAQRTRAPCAAHRAAHRTPCGAAGGVSRCASHRRRSIARALSSCN